MPDLGLVQELHTSLAALRLLAEAIGDGLLDQSDRRDHADLMVWHLHRVDELIEEHRPRAARLSR